MLIKRITSLVVAVALMEYVHFPSPKDFKIILDIFLPIFHKATEITGRIPERLILSGFFYRLSAVFQHLFY